MSIDDREKSAGAARRVGKTVGRKLANAAASAGRKIGNAASRAADLNDDGVVDRNDATIAAKKAQKVGSKAADAAGALAKDVAQERHGEGRCRGCRDRRLGRDAGADCRPGDRGRGWRCRRCHQELESRTQTRDKASGKTQGEVVASIASSASRSLSVCDTAQALADATMSWVVIVWSMMAASSLTLAVIHLFVWFRQRGDYSHLLFSLLAVSAALFGWFELAAHAGDHAGGLCHDCCGGRTCRCPRSCCRSSDSSTSTSVRGGGGWLALATCVTRLASLALNFTTGANVNFREVTGLDRLAVWGGEWVAAPVGVPNPWTVVPQASNVMLLVLVIGAAATVWRRGDPIARRRALVVGGSLVLCVGFAAGFAALIITGLVRAPTVVMPSVFIVVVAMGYELVRDVIAAAHLSTQLRASEARFRAVVQSVPTAILLVSERGSIAFANAQVRAVFGYTPDELVGRQVDDLVPLKARGAHESRSPRLHAAAADAEHGCRTRALRTPQGRHGGSDRGRPQSDADGGRSLRARLRRRRIGTQAHRASGGAAAQRSGASLAGGHAGRAVGIARARAQSAVDGDPEQRAGGAAVPRAKAAAARPGRGDHRRHREERSARSHGDPALAGAPQERGCGASAGRRERDRAGFPAAHAQRSR